MHRPYRIPRPVSASAAASRPPAASQDEQPMFWESSDPTFRIVGKNPNAEKEIEKIRNEIKRTEQEYENVKLKYADAMDDARVALQDAKQRLLGAKKEHLSALERVEKMKESIRDLETMAKQQRMQIEDLKREQSRLEGGKPTNEQQQQQQTQQQTQQQPPSTSVSSLRESIEKPPSDSRPPATTAVRFASIADSNDNDNDNQLDSVEMNFASRLPARPKPTGNTALTTKIPEPQNAASASGTISLDPPSADLKLEFVYGYRGNDCRGNLFHTRAGEAVFHAAGVGIVHHPRTGLQKHFTGHTDDILCLAVHPDGDTIATGQIGKDPRVCVWSAQKGEQLALLQGFHTNGVICVTFSSDGKYVISVGDDQWHTLAVWEWAGNNKTPKKDIRGESNKILAIATNRHDGKFATAGKNHIRFWSMTVDGAGNVNLSSKNGIFAKIAEPQTILSIAFTGRESAVTGSNLGNLLLWKGNTCIKNVSAHSGPAFALCAHPDGFVSSGKDGVIKIWSIAMQEIKTLDLTRIMKTGGVNIIDPVNSMCVRSISWVGKEMLLGTASNEVFEISAVDEAISALVQSHYIGETWALATHPSSTTFVTAGDDNTVRLWDAQSRKMIQSVNVGNKGRCAAFSPDGSAVAVGLELGKLVILEGSSLKQLHTLQHRNRDLSDVRYSPNGSKLAVGSHEKFIDVYDAAQEYRRLGHCIGHTSFITHLDWSVDGKYLQSNSGDYEVLYWDIDSMQQVKGASAMADVEWVSFTCVLGWPVQGIFPPGSDGTDVNAADRSHVSRDLIATGDDFGKVNLYRYPCLKGAKGKGYAGHSSHVTNVRFTFDDGRVITTGGGDLTVMQWRNTGVKPGTAIIAAKKPAAQPHPVVATILPQAAAITSTEPANFKQQIDEIDDGLQEYPEVKSLMHKQSTLKPADAVPPPAQVQSWQRNAQPIVQKKPTTESAKKATLAIEYVYGYRGHDCRDNLYFNKAGNAVYHAAAVGIVHHLSDNTQRFFTKHIDDITCLTMSPDEIHFVSGEVGKSPSIFVWSSENPETEFVQLGSYHERCVVAAAFSQNGDYVISIGGDDNHMFALWNWKKNPAAPIKVTRGGKSPIFVLGVSRFDGTAVSCGQNHIKFWDLHEVAGVGMLEPRSGEYGAKKQQSETILSVEFLGKSRTVTGTASGDIFVWQGNHFQQLVSAHKGPVFDLWVSGDNLLSGGQDGILQSRSINNLGDSISADLSQVRAKIVSSASSSLIVGGNQPTIVCVRSICRSGNKTLIGTAQNEIYLFSDGLNVASASLVVRGHCKAKKNAANTQEITNETWGLACFPNDNNRFVTSGDDGLIMVWDSQKRRLIQATSLEIKVRCVAVRPPNADHVAVGLENGKVCILDANNISAILSVLPPQVTSRGKTGVTDLKYNSAGTTLAVGTYAHVIELFDASDEYQPMGVCKGHSSHITHLDWSVDDNFIQSNSAGYEILYFSAATKSIVSTSTIRDVEWASWTCTLGRAVEGMFPPGSDGTDVNAVDRSHVARDLVVSGDDFGKVQLSLFPCLEGTKVKRFGGHSSHVTNVRFTKDDSHVITTGGADLSVIQWSLVRDTGAGQQQQRPQQPPTEPPQQQQQQQQQQQVQPTPKQQPQQQQPQPQPQPIHRPPTVHDGTAVKPKQQQQPPISIIPSPAVVADEEEEEETPAAAANSLIIHDEEIISMLPASRTAPHLARLANKNNNNNKQQDAPGRQFQAVAPWRGQILPPTAFQAGASVPMSTKAQLQLEYVYGYRGHDCRDNLHLAQGDDWVVFHAAAVGVVQNLRTGQQRFFLGHTDDILCLTMHPDRRTVATGEIGKEPAIWVWDSSAPEAATPIGGGKGVCLKGNVHQRAVIAMTFCDDGEHLVSVGEDDSHTMALWKWRSGLNIHTVPGGKSDVLAINCNLDDGMIVSCGVRHVKFWQREVRELKCIGNVRRTSTVICIEFAGKGIAITGDSEGQIVIYSGVKPAATVDAHAGPLLDLFRCEKSNMFLSTGKDNLVKIWNFEMVVATPKLTTLTSIDVGAAAKNVGRASQGSETSSGVLNRRIRAITASQAKNAIVIGTSLNEILMLTGGFDGGGIGKPISASVVTMGHAPPPPTTTAGAAGAGGTAAAAALARETWALCTHPVFASRFATGSGDGLVVLWDGNNKRSIGMGQVGSGVRCLDFSTDGRYLAAGLENGSVMLLSGENPRQVLSQLNARKMPITQVRFSPNGELLAVGSKDNVIDVFHVGREEKLAPACTGHSSYITHLDWSSDGAFIQSNSAAYELLFFDALTRKRVKGARAVRDVEWASFTCVLGWPVQGIFPPGTDGTDVNAVDRSNRKDLLVSADDFGKVGLCPYPCLEGADIKHFGGHSSHVTNVKFTKDDARMISTGGADLSVLQWQVIR